MNAPAFAPNPFVGLRPFEADESLLFFGRQQQIAELLRRLHDTRFLAVVGSSGCGKSSLVRAGLMPVLQAGFLVEDRDVWHIGKMKPGGAPIGNLATCLLTCAREGTGKADPGQVESLVRTIREGGAESILNQLGDLVANRDSNLLLLVDQFEEIFRFDQHGGPGGGSEEASDFVSILLDLAAQHEMPIYVVITMRSDFLGDCDVFFGLPEALNHSQYLVPRLSREQRREAIEGPIKLYRQEIASRLTDRLLNETIDTRDDLPVLQHALMRTWDCWQPDGRGPIDIGHYEQIGTIYRALSRDADAALEGMDERHLVWTKRLFQALTTVDSGNRGTRRPARLNDVAARSAADPADVWSIVNRFRSEGRSFLVASTEDLRADPLIDISHESLIRQWSILGKWVEEEAESIKIYKRLAETERLRKAGKSGLYRDQDLQVALDWQARESPNPAWAKHHQEDFDAAMAFLRESKEVRDNALAEAEFTRRWRRARVVIVALVLGLLFFDLGLRFISEFWRYCLTSVSYLLSALAQQVGKSNAQSVQGIAEAMTTTLRFGVHAALYLTLAFLVKQTYRAFAFPSILAAITGTAGQAAGQRKSKVTTVRKLIHSMPRFIEGLAKWTSIIAGVSVVGSCTVAGVSGGGGGVFVVLIGLVLGLLLVGWVFAVARLNAEVKTIRTELEQNRKPEPESMGRTTPDTTSPDATSREAMVRGDVNG